MGGKGRTPRGRNGARVVSLYPTSGKRRYGKPLPAGLLGVDEETGEPREWHKQTLSWWASLRQWSMLENEPSVSWDFLVATAVLVDAFYARGRLDYAGEIRLRLSKYAVAPEDRQRLGVTLRTPADESGSPSSTGIDPARRARLLGEPKAR